MTERETQKQRLYSLIAYKEMKIRELYKDYQDIYNDLSYRQVKTFLLELSQDGHLIKVKNGTYRRAQR